MDQPSRNHTVLLAAALNPQRRPEGAVITPEDWQAIERGAHEGKLLPEDLAHLKKLKNPFSAPLDKLNKRAAQAAARVDVRHHDQRPTYGLKVAASGGGGGGDSADTVIKMIRNQMDLLGRDESFFPDIARRLRIDPFKKLDELGDRALRRALGLVRRDVRKARPKSGS